MDNKALAETYVDLYEYIEGYFETKLGAKPVTQVTNMVFEQTCKRIISDRIGEQRGGVPTQQSEQRAEKPSEKQIAFANKLGCDEPERYTKKELSAWIDKHKAF